MDHGMIENKNVRVQASPCVSQLHALEDRWWYLFALRRNESGSWLIRSLLLDNGLLLIHRVQSAMGVKWNGHK